MAPPNNLPRTPGILGFVRILMSFCPELCHHLSALDISPPKNAFIWTPPATKAFHELKQALTQTPLLQLPDFHFPFEIQTDAFATGIGAVVLQHQHPIAYFSKQLPPRLHSALAYAREMYAITESVRRWRQYFLGRRFVVYTDHQSLRSLLHQTVQTPDQHKWLTKLLGYEFDILYKPGAQNKPVDALSRVYDDSLPAHAALSVFGPQPTILDAFHQYYPTDNQSATLFRVIQSDPFAHPDYHILEGILFFQDRIFVPLGSTLQHLTLTEFHTTPIGGHTGMRRTHHSFARTFFWPNLRRLVREFVQRCMVCQSVKPFNHASQGLLQPLQIPEKIWDSASLDFITHLPNSNGKTVILVVIDRLSKQGHFIGLGSQFIALQVAEIFIREIVRIHGIPISLISYRDPVFMNQFWRELFRLQGKTLSMSSAYDPQIDGQTERLNRYLEDYLRSFTAEQPCHWFRYLPWAEWHYNTSWNSTIQTTHYDVVFGRPPPTLLDDVAGTTTVTAVDDLLADRSQLLCQLKENLHNAQLPIKNQADSKRTAISFEIGDWVFLRLQPFIQISLHRQSTHKLSKRFFGPFQIIDKIGPVSYRLALPSIAQLHNVFHVSKLKRCVSDPHVQHLPLPACNPDQQPHFNPVAILPSRDVLHQGRSECQHLVQWEHQSAAEAT